MRILILGAGGTGGYFGGRLAQGGADVTFLVRAGRAEQLKAHGLQIRSPLGDADFPVQSVVADDLPTLAQAQPFDLVLLSCKAYDLDSSIAAIAPAVRARTTVLPILNGLAHYAALDAAFGAARVLGGLCFISAMKGPQGEVQHFGKAASMTFGERETAALSDRVTALASLCEQAGVQHVASGDIATEQWTKYSFLCALAATTCLMRAPVGEIVAAEGGQAFIEATYAETLAVAAAAGHPVPGEKQQAMRKILTEAGSKLTASMLRDLLAGQAVEGAHIVGDMVHRAAQAGIATPCLQAAWIHLQAYTAGRIASAG
ncbi:MAG: 2-dehydropantoate 2-reductase [Pseudoxanthomonas sp.]